MSKDERTGNEIAIVGMAGRFPDAPDVAALWGNLRDGVESVRKRSDDELRAAGVSEAQLRDPSYVKASAVLADFDAWDAKFFGFSPRDAAIMDPQHRLFLELAVEALEHAGHAPESFPGAIGVFAAAGAQSYYHQHILRNRALVRDVGLFLLRHTGNDKDFLATRVSYLLDLKGPAVSVQTACSSSLVAIHMASQSLLNGETDLALAGACTIELPHGHGYVYHPGEILSPDGHCRPFDVASGGTVFGSGGGVVILRRLSDAIEAGDTIHAVLLGSAVNNDGAGKVGYLAPSVDGQAAAIAEALDIAGVSAESIGLVEAHGTGTAVGDPIEVAALTQAFRRSTDKRGFCRLGSLKSNIGHTDTAAGVAGLLKVVMAMRARQIPPTLHYTAPNPVAQLPESPFTVNTVLEPWASPMRAGVSSLGVGGTNAHVVVEEPPSPVEAGEAVRFAPFVVSAHTRTALGTLANRLADALESADAPGISDAAFTLATGRTARKERLAIVADTAAEAAQQLRRAAATARTAGDARLAFMFAGGGAQYAGMGRDLQAREPVFRDAVARAVAAMPADVASGVRRVLSDPSATADAARPAIGLPALVAVQLGMLAMARAAGLEPQAVIGHSVGEYTAAHVAGVLDHDALIRIVVARGRLFETLPRGAMTSISTDAVTVRALISSGTDAVSLAAENAPSLSVVSGSPDAVTAFEQRAMAAGHEVRRVPIDVAAHSPMLEPILDAFEREVATLRLSPPTLKLASNLRGAWLTADDATSPAFWRQHLRDTVRYADGVALLLSDASLVPLELGPGRTLASLTRQHPAAQGRAVVSSMRRADDVTDDGAAWHEALGKVWCAGVTPDWGAVFRTPRRRVPLPTTPFERQRHWVEPDAADTPDDMPITRADDRASWRQVPVWQSRPAGTAPLRDERVLVLHAGPMGEQCAAMLAAVHPGGPSAVRAVLVQGDAAVREAVASASASDDMWPQRVVLATALDLPPVAADDAGVAFAATERSAHALRDLLTVAQWASDAGDRTPSLVVVTAGAASVSGEPVRHFAGAALHGAVPVVRREVPATSAWTVDVAVDAAQMPRLDATSARVMLSDGPAEGLAAVRAGQVFVRHFAPAAAPAATPLPASPVVLVSGGLGGLALAIAADLAPHGARLALLTSRGLPARETWDAHLTRVGDADETARRISAIRGLEAAGAEVLVLSADVTDEGAVHAAVEQVRERWGRLDVVLHAAGALDDALLVRKDAARLHGVLAPKVAGALALDRATRALAPSRFVCFSSVSALAGLAGQFDYAAANAVLDAFAAWRDAAVGSTTSLAWPAWREVGMAVAAARGGARAPTGVHPVASAVHPFLDRMSSLPDGGLVYDGVLAPSRDWVLDEHRLADGTSVFPGAGMADMFLAVAQQAFGGPCTLHDFLVQAALRVPDDARAVVRVVARPSNDGLELALYGETRDGTWECARAVARPGAVAVPLEPAPRVTAADPTSAGQSSLRFGPRWRVLQELARGTHDVTARLALPTAFASEAAAHAVHPALYDIATAVGLTLLGDDPTVAWVPTAVGAVRLLQPLPAEVLSRSHVHARPSPNSAVFDVRLTTLDGTPVLELDEFTLRAIPVAQFATGAVVAEPAVGIAPADGCAVLRMVLADPPAPHVVVAPAPVADVVRTLAAPPVPAARKVTAVGDAPVDDLERTIAAEFQARLGGGPVGRHDDFFELGGHSLLLTQALARLRTVLKADLPVRAVFTSPTVAALATLARSATTPAAAPPPLVRAAREGRRVTRAALAVDQTR
jgi:acyl transferase domain-containing protein